MAGPYELMELEGYNRGPDSNIRNQKQKVEEELLIKLGAKKEMIEIHPLILSSRFERARTFSDLQYSRSTPPAAEKTYVSRNPWHSSDQALRQMCNPPRRGPRDFVLPNLVKSTDVKIVEVPAADFGFFARREAILERLHIILDEWAVYERRAFPPLVNRLSTLREFVPTKPVKELTKANVKSLNQETKGKRKSFYSWSTSSNQSSEGKKFKQRAEHRKKTRWSRMAQEALLQLKASHVRMPDVLPKSELRIYVCSTPDLHEEREFLEEVAYPKMKELCEKIGLNCHFVDMRKGSGFLSNDIETFDLIDKELRNCRQLSIGPYFVSLLGHELDDQKLPGFLGRSVYEKIREILVKQKMIGVEMFDEAYRLDSNRLPAVYIKQPLRAINEYQGPEHVEEILLTALNSALAYLKDKDEEIEDFYKWSAVVREVEVGLLSSLNPKRETLCFLFENGETSVDDDEENVKPSSPVERLRDNVIRHYTRMASTSTLMKFKSGRKTIPYLRSLADTFIASMASMLKAQVRQSEYDVTQQMTEGSEALQHVRLALSEADVVAENSRLLGKVKDVLFSDEDPDTPKTVLLVGASGSGKTTLVSLIAKNSLMWDPRRKVVFRCLGLTLRSSSLFRAMESLNKQLNFLYSLDNFLPSDSNLKGAISIFCRTLNLISECRQGNGNLLLILDNLEKLRDVDIHVFLKIINSVNDGIRLVLSLDETHPFSSVLTSHPAVNTIRMVPLNKTDINDFTKQKLSLSKRRVTQDQMTKVLSAIPSDSSPVYVEMVCNMIKCWPSHTLPDLEKFSGHLEGDFNVFLEVVEKEVGQAFTRYALSLLVASRHGLAEGELVYLLAEDGDLLNEIKAEQDESVSVVEGFSYQLHLSRLISMLGKFVVEVKIEGETVFQSKCTSLNCCIHDRYMKNEFFYTIHNRLATFFLFIRRGLLLSSKDISEKKFKELSKYQWRMMRSVPYHLCFSSPDPDQVWATLKEKVFFNFSWLVNEIYSGFYVDLMYDVRFALENVDLDPDIQYLQQFLLSTAYTTIHNPLSLASVFASQNIHETEENIKDSVRDVVREARQWLKQLHTQALIPMEYTTDKINRLLIKKNTLRNVTDMWSDDLTANLILQRDKSIFLSNMVTGEELRLVTFENKIELVHVSDDRTQLFISTTDHDARAQIDVLDIHKGENVNTMPLYKDDFKWMDFRSKTEIYSANNAGIQLINFEKNKMDNIWSQKKSWLECFVTLGKIPRIVTITIEDKMKVEILTMKTLSLRMISFKDSNLNPQCKPPFLSTKDGRFLVLIFEREASVIDLVKSEQTETFSHNGLPIIGAHLSRSHEHIFLAYMNGSVTCHVLYSGNTSMVAKINSRKSESQSQSSSTMSPEKSESRNQPSSGRGSNSSKASKMKSAEPWSDDHEKITSMITSEDDHFLFCGTSIGVVYILYVPTGHQVVTILSPRRPIKKLIYLTSREHFQHLVTLNEDGLAVHWNLRPLFKQARALVKPYIHDNDLLKEEQTKIQLREYYKKYQSHSTDRVFLNGPDIAAFYNELPHDVFESLERLDPAFKPAVDWESTGTFADCSELVKTFVCGKVLGDMLLTISTDMRLAKWSLYDGSLMWCRKLSFGHGHIHNAALMYYDQALMVTETKGPQAQLSIAVVYLMEGQNTVLTKTNAIGYWTSQDRCQVMILCQDQEKGDELQFYFWDLITATEVEKRYSDVMVGDMVQRDSLLFTTVSPGLNQIIRLSLVDKKSQKEGTDLSSEEYTPVDRAIPNLQRTPRTFPEMSIKKDIMGMNGRLSSTMIGSPIPPDQLLSNQASTFASVSRDDSDEEEEFYESIPTKQVRFQTPTVSRNGMSNKTGISDELGKQEDAVVSEAGDVNIMMSWNILDINPQVCKVQETLRSNDKKKSTDSQPRRSSSSPKSSKSKPTSDNEPVDKIHRSSQSKHESSNPNEFVESKQKFSLEEERHEGGKIELEDKGYETRHEGNKEQTDEFSEIREHGEIEPTEKLKTNWCFLKLDLSGICFTGEENVFVGTMTGHVMLLNIPTFHIACVLTVDGPRLLPIETLASVLTTVTTPHRCAITYVGTSDDGSCLVSADSRTVCLWNNLNRQLLMTISLGSRQELTHMMLSKDAAIVAIVTNNRVMQIWTSVGSPREIASYMTNFDVLDLNMSADCHKIVVRGKGQENETIMEIFELKNIDDILMHVQNRKQSRNEETKQSHDEERRSSMVSKRRRSRQMSDRRRSSASVTKSPIQNH